MRKISLFIPALVLASGISGCAEDEMTIFVEHAKAPAGAPACAYSAGDPWVSSGLLDLAFRNPYGTAFLLNVQLNPRVDPDSLHVESAGVVIEGMEVFVQTPRGEGVGATEYFEFEHYLPPNSREIATGIVISPAIAERLAENYNCLPLDAANYPATSVGIDINGEDASRYLGFVYSQVVFLGHTLSHILVETPEFTFPVQLCCGCLVDWFPCMDECCRHCVLPIPHGMCTPGVANGGLPFDCRSLYYDPNYNYPYCGVCEPLC